MNILKKWETEYRLNMIQDLVNENIEIARENIPKIIRESSYESRKKKYPNKCPYYSKETSCHPEIKDLNCFLCPCPNYDSNTDIGGCKIDSKFGEYHKHPNLPKGFVWDCSNCGINHSKEEVEIYLNKNLDNLLSSFS
jgi:Zn-finger protein